MKRTITALLIALLAVAAASAALIGCTTASASDAPERGYEFRDISDYFAPRVSSGAVRVKQEMDARAAQEAAEAEKAAQEAWEYQEPYYADYTPSYGVTRGNPDGLNSFDGVYEFNGKTETFYGTPAVYDDQLWVDDDGFWRTEDGYYVVASEDYQQGEHIQISQGEAVVMDGGCEPGVVDVHVSGWN